MSKTSNGPSALNPHRGYVTPGSAAQRADVANVRQAKRATDATPVLQRFEGQYRRVEGTMYAECLDVRVKDGALVGTPVTFEFEPDAATNLGQGFATEIIGQAARIDRPVRDDGYPARSVSYRSALEGDHAIVTTQHRVDEPQGFWARLFGKKLVFETTTRIELQNDTLRIVRQQPNQIYDDGKEVRHVTVYRRVG